MSAKIFRDPLYNCIAIDPSQDRWLIELLDTAEVQRLSRERLSVVDPPPTTSDLAPNFNAWEKALADLVRTKTEYNPPEMYCLKDEVKAKYNQPYFPEKEADEQSVKNAIRIKIDGEKEPVEISTLLDRLKPLTQEPVNRVRYYIPKDLQAQARKMRAEWKDPI